MLLAATQLAQACFSMVSLWIIGCPPRRKGPQSCRQDMHLSWPAIYSVATVLQTVSHDCFRNFAMLGVGVLCCWLVAALLAEDIPLIVCALVGIA